MRPYELTFGGIVYDIVSRKPVCMSNPYALDWARQPYGFDSNGKRHNLIDLYPIDIFNFDNIEYEGFTYLHGDEPTLLYRSNDVYISITRENTTIIVQSVDGNEIRMTRPIEHVHDLQHTLRVACLSEFADKHIHIK